MINVIKSADRYHADHGWLQTHWHFSFSDYYDPANMRFGPLRVFNDDVIAPGGGFPPHPHADMEIITLVLKGALEHKDNLGSHGVLRPGEVQVMSAGSGIEHSEFNHSRSEPVHLLQLWILPRNKGTKPRWAQRAFDGFQRPGQLVPVVSGGDVPDTLSIDQDVTIYEGMLPAGARVNHVQRQGRRTYLFVIRGSLTVNKQSLSAGDQARITDETGLDLETTADTELVLLDLP